MTARIMSSVVRVARYAGALAVVVTACAGCGGGSHRKAPVREQPVASSEPVITTPVPATLHDASGGPMLCAVYENGYATQIIFASQSFDVRADCRAWTADKAAAGFLWGYQPARATEAPTESKQICSLTDPAGLVAAQVIEVTGLRAVSAAEAARASSACHSLLASGWLTRGQTSSSADSRTGARSSHRTTRPKRTSSP